MQATPIGLATFKVELQKSDFYIVIARVVQSSNGVLDPTVIYLACFLLSSLIFSFYEHVQSKNGILDDGGVVCHLI